MTTPLVTQRIEDLTIAQNSDNTTLDLSQNFDDPLTTGQIARFEFADDSLGGVTDVLLFDQAGEGASETVANFVNYVEDNDYANSIIHRSVPGFIVQGGGFAVDPELNFEPNLDAIEPIPADDSVINEFSPSRSNTRGTIAMAKRGGDPNSATNQWFFNLNDNSEILNERNNGGFTVFGEVLSAEDFAPVDAIALLPTSDASRSFSQPVPQFAGAFSELPLIIEDAENANFVGLNNVTLLQQPELEFAVIENSNPDLVNATINDGELVLDYAADGRGIAEITISATDLQGDTVEDMFIVAVENAQPNLSQEGSTVYRFLNTNTGVHFYTSSEVERDAILENLPNYVSEGSAYVSVDPFTGSPEPEQVYRFLNRDTGTHLYTVSDIEKESVEQNLPNYSLETESFFAFTEQQPGTIPIYRFFNTGTGAHFYTPSETEREVVEQTLPNYQSEGIAYYTFPVGE